MTRKPYWPALCEECLQPENFPRVLASLGVTRHLGALPRGLMKWWPPEYFRPPAPPNKYSHDIAAAFLTSRRRDLGGINRSIRDSPVHLVVIPGPPVQGAPYAMYGRVLGIDEAMGDGEWRTTDGANRGRDIISLAMWRWSCKFGQAAFRLSRTISFTIPSVEDKK